MAYNIESLTHEQIVRHIKERPAVIIPLGGCEPFGGVAAVGTESVCVAEIAGELSKRCNILVAPLIPFGCSAPFMSFAGSAGVKPRTFVNMLCDISHAYIFQGVKKIFLINAAPFNKEPMAEAARRLEAKYPQVSVAAFDINACMGSDAGIDRNDALLLSLLSYLRPELFTNEPICYNKIPQDQYRTWKKRGRDPQKLRKLSPNGLLLTSQPDICSTRGQEYFELIVETISKEMVF